MSSKTEKDKTKQLQDKCQSVLNTLLRDEDNKYCVDCDSKGGYSVTLDLLSLEKVVSINSKVEEVLNIFADYYYFESYLMTFNNF